MTESLECTFIKKRTLNRHSFKKNNTHKKPQTTKNVGWVRFLRLLQSILSSKIHSKIIF